ncbi:MAG TPA: 3-deoxy-D-manno-octulosonic acid transferase [Pseudolabrys sp.]|nr:3-deoxy-D-manno-octulosonic acid transferase [Pseudolabrys sp.]
MSDRLPLALRAYRVLSAAATPLTPLLLARRLKRGKEHRQRFGERRGEARSARPPGPLVWLHGASVGELMSVLPLIERLSTRGVEVLVTSGTVTSSDLAEQRLPPGVVHQFVPLDVPRFVRRFLDHWQPNLALFVESDLWPNMVIETSRRGVPMVLVNGRVSENSFRRWNRLPSFIVDLLQRFELCLARTPADGARLSELGAPNVITAGNLKLDVPAPPAEAAKLEQLQMAVGRRPVIAATSTHPGEDELVIAAHRRLRANFPGLVTVIAPRHPQRGPAIAELVKSAGLSAALRSAGELPKRSTEIYIADTLGELGLIYRLAPVVFIGGSLVPHGGQNPIEAAKLGAAIVHGPHVANFAEIYGALDTARGAETVGDGQRLTAALGALLAQPDRRERLATAARTTVDRLGGALERTLQALDPYLMQMQLRQQTEHA